MQLKPEQVAKFKLIHKGSDFDKYTDEQISEIANGVANYFLALFKIHRRTQVKTVDDESLPSG